MVCKKKKSIQFTLSTYIFLNTNRVIYFQINIRWYHNDCILGRICILYLHRGKKKASRYDISCTQTLFRYKYEYNCRHFIIKIRNTRTKWEMLLVVITYDTNNSSCDSCTRHLRLGFANRYVKNLQIFKRQKDLQRPIEI